MKKYWGPDIQLH